MTNYPSAVSLHNLPFSSHPPLTNCHVCCCTIGSDNSEVHLPFRWGCVLYRPGVHASNRRRDIPNSVSHSPSGSIPVHQDGDSHCQLQSARTMGEVEELQRPGREPSGPLGATVEGQRFCSMWRQGRRGSNSALLSAICVNWRHGTVDGHSNPWVGRAQNDNIKRTDLRWQITYLKVILKVLGGGGVRARNDVTSCPEYQHISKGALEETWWASVLCRAKKQLKSWEE
jgi:hypothetical protein